MVAVAAVVSLKALLTKGGHNFMKYKSVSELKIAVIGLGYVGLPLAVGFSQYFDVVGYDLNESRINQVASGFDSTFETQREQLVANQKLRFTNRIAELADCNCYIVTVPTPVDKWNRPDLSALKQASYELAKLIFAGDLIIFESTVFPGATEEVCGTILATQSGLKLAISDEDDPAHCFYLGYSPERINPGDKKHKLKDIKKVTSGSSPAASRLIDNLYQKVISAGTYRASSIRVAEAAKVIENIQRDVNIALINELAILFERLGIDTEEILNAAGTKWNFLPFRPGLVGGHCIGVDPYYLTHKAAEVGHNPEMILAGRRINENMSSYVADRIVRMMLEHRINVLGARVLVLGLAFKENCPDIRNSKVFDLITCLNSFHCIVDVLDPIIDPDVVADGRNFTLVPEALDGKYDAIVLAVGHDEFLQIGAERIRQYGKPHHVLFDVKYVFPADAVDGRL